MTLGNDERRIVRERIDEYLKNPLYPFRGKTVERTKRWAFGESMTQIAKDEGVSQVSISQSVRSLALKIIEFSRG